MFGLAPVSECELPADGRARADASALRLLTASGDATADRFATVPLRSDRARTLLRSILGAP